MGLRRRRKRLPSSDIPKWDDPDLKCRMGLSPHLHMTTDEASARSQRLVKSQAAPDWRYDPSYNWAARARRP